MVAVALALVGLACVAGVTVDVDLSSSTHVLNPLYLGCHSDTGYVQTARGLYSQLILDESFEQEQSKESRRASANDQHPSPAPPPTTWGTYSSEGGSATIRLDKTQAMNGFSSMQVDVLSGHAGIFNRGNNNAGLFVVPGKTYEGYFFANSSSGGGGSSGSVAVTASLYNYVTNTTLGSTAIKVATTTTPEVASHIQYQGFTQYPFVITTEASGGGAECTDVIKCSGEFRLEVTEPGAVNFDYVFLQPGSWGRFANLSVHKSGADLLSEMGIKAMRQGGSFAGESPWYQWEKWTGPAYKRESVGARWGNDLIAGWGPFDFIDFANAAGIEAVMTTTSTTSVESFADLVEYCWGSSTTTKMGKQRAVDGHAEPYKVSFFELGNEGSDGAINKDGPYVDQVVAMETKARELGIGGKLFYLFPSGGASVTTPSTAFSEFLSPHNLQEAVAAVKAGKVAASQMVDSQHTGHHPYYWGGGAAGLARHLMNEPDLKDVLEIGACNTETNAKQQAQNRAMMEAGDLNDWFNVVDIAKRLHLRASSFCMAQADHADNAGFNQGIAGFMPNMTFIQPPGYVHAMVSSTWQPNGLAVVVKGDATTRPLARPDLWGSRWNLTYTASAAVSDDKKTAVVRLHSNSSTATLFVVNIHGGNTNAESRVVGSNDAVVTAVNGTLLAAPSLWSFNTPANPNAVAPTTLSVQQSGASSIAVKMPAHSFAVLTLHF